MPKYIELEKALQRFEEIKKNTTLLKESFYLDGVMAILETIPAADVAPVVHGKRVKAKKHNWKKDIDGEIDLWAWEEGYCNGPLCLECGESFCIHCEEKNRGKDAIEFKLNEETCCERIVCSVCGRTVPKDAQYCNCGAKMILEDD